MYLLFVSLLLVRSVLAVDDPANPGLGYTSGSFQCFRGWYQELENPSGATTAETWNLGAADHDEGTVCGGYGGSCPDYSQFSMRETDVQRLILSTENSHFALTAYEIHDHSRNCPPLQFCVQPLSYVYIKTRAYWPLLWRYTGNPTNDRICVRTQYPGYVWMQGVDTNTGAADHFKALPTPDTIKLLDHMNVLDANVTNGYFGCFNTKGDFKTSCPALDVSIWSTQGLDGLYIRTDYPNWVFLQGMTFTPSNKIPKRADLQYNIPMLLKACDDTKGCNVVMQDGTMDVGLFTTSSVIYRHSNTLPQLSGMWIRRDYAENGALGLGLTPQPKSY